MKRRSLSVRTLGRLRLGLTVCRVWLVLTNAVAGAFMVGVVAFNLYLRSTEGLRDLIQSIIPPIFEFYYLTIVVFCTTSIGHGLLCLRMIRPWFQRKSSTVAFVPVAPTTGMIPSSSIQLRRTRILTWIDRYILEITKVRMLVEIAMQTFQAKKTSQLVAKRWINELMALILITNCWFSLLIQAILSKYPPAVVRIARLVVDSVLDVAYCIVIPLSIFVPHYLLYTSMVPGVPLINYYIDTWYANMVSEVRQILMISWPDCISKCFAAFSMLYRMHVVDRVLVRAKIQYDQGYSKTSDDKTVPPSQLCLRRLLDATMFLWGVVVTALYIQTAVVTSQIPNVKCLLEMRPWGTLKYTCAVLEVNCWDHGTSGQRSVLQTAIEQVDADYVQVLVLSHCPGLDIPPVLQQLGYLRTFKIYNSTIASWGLDAALTEKSHTQLGLLLFPRVNMSTIPVGLLADDFPTSVWDIELSASNLTTLPQEVVYAWKNVVLFVMERNPQMTEIPSAALRLPQLRVLVVNRNSINAVNDNAFDGTLIVQLIIDANPLVRLPTSASQCMAIGMSGTKVAELPSSWSRERAIGTGAAKYIRAGGTPLCEGLRTHNGDIMIPSTFVIDCGPVTPRSFGYPIEDEDAWRSM